MRSQALRLTTVKPAWRVSIKPVGRSPARTSGTERFIPKFYHDPPGVGFPPDLAHALLVKRLNRFAVLVERAGVQLAAHLANSGRLQELLVPGRDVWLAPRAGPHRRTAWDLVLVAHEGILVAVDSRLANSVIAAALTAGAVTHFSGFSRWRREVRLGTSRIDFAALEGPRTCFVEAKCVTLVEGGRALFPDAPTLRGTRHLRELTAFSTTASAAGVLFVVQRPDARTFAPNQRADPLFCAALKAAREAGVVAAAYRCSVTVAGIALDEPLPTELE